MIEMQIRISKSRTIKDKENYKKAEFEITDEIESNYDELEMVKERLNGIIEGWLFEEQNNVTEDLSLKSDERLCPQCGNPMKKYYKLCFDCNQKAKKGD